MATGSTTGGFPKITLLIFAALQIFVGLFSFIYVCILVKPIMIMIAMLFIALGVIVLLTGLNVLKILETNVPLVSGIVVISTIINFIQFVFYCLLANNSRYVRSSAHLGVSIVLVLMLVGLMISGVILMLLLMKHGQTCTMTNSTGTTVTTTRTATTTIETPPANYINQPNSQGPM